MVGAGKSGDVGNQVFLWRILGPTLLWKETCLPHLKPRGRLHRISQDIPEAAEDGGGGLGGGGLLSAQQLHFHLQQKGSVDQT